MENICSKPAVIKHSFKCRFVVTADSERCLFVLVMLYKLRSIVTDREGVGVSCFFNYGTLVKARGLFRKGISCHKTFTLYLTAKNVREEYIFSSSSNKKLTIFFRLLAS